MKKFLSIIFLLAFVTSFAQTNKWRDSSAFLGPVSINGGIRMAAGAAIDYVIKSGTNGEFSWAPVAAGSTGSVLFANGSGGIATPSPFFSYNGSSLVVIQNDSSANVRTNYLWLHNGSALQRVFIHAPSFTTNTTINWTLPNTAGISGDFLKMGSGGKWEWGSASASLLYGRVGIGIAGNTVGSDTSITVSFMAGNPRFRVYNTSTGAGDVQANSYYWKDAAGTNDIRFKTPIPLKATYGLFWPDSAASASNQAMVNDGSGNLSWQTVSLGGSGWNLNGNSGTNPFVNFIGTSDAVDSLIFAMGVGRNVVGMVERDSANTWLGYNAGGAFGGGFIQSFTTAIGKTDGVYRDGKRNVFLGYNASKLSAFSNINDAVGLGYNAKVDNNGIAIGSGAQAGIDGVAIGKGAIAPDNHFVVGTNITVVRPSDSCGTSLGDANHPWSDLFVCGSTIHLGDIAISSTGSGANKLLQINGSNTGVWVTANSSLVGLDNVNNTSDANKPVSTAQQTAFNLKADTSTINAKFPYKSYHASITQSSTGAPTATVFLNELGTTLTWGRTSSGLYTVTAGASIFTAGKTHIFLEPADLDLVQFKTVKTSTSIITLTSNLNSVIATVLTAVGTDALLTNALIEIRVYN